MEHLRNPPVNNTLNLTADHFYDEYLRDAIERLKNGTFHGDKQIALELITDSFFQMPQDSKFIRYFDLFSDQDTNAKLNLDDWDKFELRNRYILHELDYIDSMAKQTTNYDNPSPLDRNFSSVIRNKLNMQTSSFQDIKSTPYFMNTIKNFSVLVDKDYFLELEKSINVNAPIPLCSEVPSCAKLFADIDLINLPKDHNQRIFLNSYFLYSTKEIRNLGLQNVKIDKEKYLIFLLDNLELGKNNLLKGYGPNSSAGLHELVLNLLNESLETILTNPELKNDEKLSKRLQKIVNDHKKIVNMINEKYPNYNKRFKEKINNYLHKHSNEISNNLNTIMKNLKRCFQN